jgi:hypothetical protein
MLDKSVPKGLRDQEVERASPHQPPIPYIPVEDKIAEQVKEAAGTGSFKIELPNSTKVTQSQWNLGNNEAFLIHVMSALSICDRKKLFETYEKAETALDEAREEAKVAKVILVELDPKATKEQKSQAKKDHEAKQALVKEQLAIMNKKHRGMLLALWESPCWVRCRYCLAGITKLGEQVAKNTKLE